MAEYGVYQIPREIKDEDKWFRYFTKKQALVVVLCGIADYRLINYFAARDLVIVGILLACLITVLFVGSMMVVLPLDNFFLAGGGLTIVEWLFRWIYRSKSKCIYAKNMDEESGV